MLFKKKTDDEKPESRSLAFMLPLVILFMLVSSIVGLVASSMSISSSKEKQLIDEYVSSCVTFSVIGIGEHEETEEKRNLSIYVPLNETDEYRSLITLNATSIERSGNYNVYVYSFSSAFSSNELERVAKENGYEYYYTYERVNDDVSIKEAYNSAYNLALEKAEMIVASTGKNWRITKVEELLSEYDPYTATTTSNVKITFAVN